MSEYRVEKRREAAELTLTSGGTIDGFLFLSGSSPVHTGPERVGDLLNLEPGFFPVRDRDWRDLAREPRARVEGDAAGPGD